MPETKATLGRRTLHDVACREVFLQGKVQETNIPLSFVDEQPGPLFGEGENRVRSRFGTFLVGILLSVSDKSGRARDCFVLRRRIWYRSEQLTSLQPKRKVGDDAVAHARFTGRGARRQRAHVPAARLVLHQLLNDLLTCRKAISR